MNQRPFLDLEADGSRGRLRFHRRLDVPARAVVLAESKDRVVERAGPGILFVPLDVFIDDAQQRSGGESGSPFKFDRRRILHSKKDREDDEGVH